MIEHVRLLLALLCASSVLAACTTVEDRATSEPPSASTSSAPETSSAPPMASPGRPSTRLGDWPTYHHGPDRSGRVAVGPRGRLRQGWTRHLDGPVYGEPLVVGDHLVAATGTNQVYGLAARTGRVRWRTGLGVPQPLDGLPCGNIDPLGVLSTPAYDAHTGSVFVAAETRGGTHTLWALDVRTGRARWHRSLDTQPKRDKLAEQQRSALLVTDGRVITVFGGLAGDCSNYVGYVTSVPTDGRGRTASYAVPTAREAGMWATPGAVVGTNGSIYVASGNGAEVNGKWDRSDSVIELDPTTLDERSVFAPGSWQDDNVHDLDLGSMAPAVVADANRIVIAGKRGVVYLLGPRLGGVGSELASLEGCVAFGGAAVVGRTVLLPCLGQGSVRALHVGPGRLSWGWTRPRLYGSPVVAGSKVYVTDQDSGDLVVLSLATGHQVWRHHAGEVGHFPSQVVAGDWVFVPTLAGITAFRGSSTG